MPESLPVSLFNNAVNTNIANSQIITKIQVQTGECRLWWPFALQTYGMFIQVCTAWATTLPWEWSITRSNEIYLMRQNVTRTPVRPANRLADWEDRRRGFDFVAPRSCWGWEVGHCTYPR